MYLIWRGLQFLFQIQDDFGRKDTTLGGEIIRAAYSVVIILPLILHALGVPVFLLALVLNANTFRVAKGIRNIAERLAKRDLASGAKFPQKQKAPQRVLFSYYLVQRFDILVTFFVKGLFHVIKHKVNRFCRV